MYVGLSTGIKLYVVLLGNTHYSHSASLHLDKNME